MVRLWQSAAEQGPMTYAFRPLAAALAGLFFLTAPMVQAADDPAAEDRAAVAAIPSVTVASAAMAEVQAHVPMTGTLVARQQVQVYPQVAGFEITELLVEAGDAVAEGQVLARLSDATLKAQLAQAEAEWQRATAGVRQAQSQITSAEAARTQAVTALDRAQRLKSTGNASQATVDQAVAAEAGAQAQAASAADGLAVAEAARAQADASRSIAALNVARTEIKAPVGGIVVTRNAQLGAIAAAGGEPLFVIVAGGEIELEAEVVETALQSLRPDLPAEIRVAGLGTVQGRVRLVPASVDPVTRLGVVRVALEDDDRLRTGLFASGFIVTERREAITVPASAVLTDAGGERVQVVRDGQVETRQVRAGLLWQQMREITEGIEVGEQVIARSGGFFRDGDRVNAVTPAATAPDAATPTATDDAPPPAAPSSVPSAAQAGTPAAPPGDGG